MGLESELADLGIAPGDTVMVHASMRAVGGRAETLLSALDHAVGPQGHLLMLICAQEDAPFDPLVSAAWDELGVLAEVFRSAPGTVVNDHPVARFAARGPQARALIWDPPLDDYYGPGSPLDRLVQRGGKVLRLGADEDTLTLFHHAEYRADLPHKRRAQRKVLCAGPGGPHWVHLGCLDDDDGVAEFAGEGDYFAHMWRAYRDSEQARRGPVGHAAAELCDARSLVAHGVAWLEANLLRAGR